MAEFTPINTQEELDRVIASRLQRERETISKQFQAQLTERDQKITGYESQVKELNTKLDGFAGQTQKITEMEAKIKGYETSSVKMRIAREVGLPYELAERLSGEDEKAIKADAEMLKRLVGTKTAPLKSTEPGGANVTAAAWSQMLQQMKGE
ncbi:MAG: DUF4355 domain-containing protein [Clostridia bacterium]|nr:DUF4355 domain-containing protein [Clostridia bacterium]